MLGGSVGRGGTKFRTGLLCLLTLLVAGLSSMTTPHPPSSEKSTWFFSGDT